MLSYEHYCGEIATQSELLSLLVSDGNLATPVGSCPGWTVNQLVRHLGGGQRWAADIVRTRASEPPPDDHFRDLSGYVDEDPGMLAHWLVDSGRRLCEALRSAGPDTPMWGPVPGQETSSFFARRFTHETAIHRADATLALGAEYWLDEPVALDALAEWLELVSLPIMFDVKPEMRELLGAGRTIHLHATDAPAEWVIDLTGERIVCREGHEKSAVAVRGALVDLLLVLYRRRPVTSVEVLGDAELFDFYLARNGFG